jgi:hypothetical protein
VVHRSGIARRVFQGARETGRPLEAVGNAAKRERLHAVLALLASSSASSRAPARPSCPRRVVGVEHSTPPVRKRTSQIIRIQQNDCVTAATMAARRRPAASIRQRTTTH